MTPVAAVAVRAAGVRVGLRPDGIVSLEAAVPPSPELLEAARQHRDEFAGLLRAEAHPAAAGFVTPGAPLPIGPVSGTIGCPDQPADPLAKLREWVEAHADAVAEWGGVPDLSRLVLPSEARRLLGCWRDTVGIGQGRPERADHVVC